MILILILFTSCQNECNPQEDVHYFGARCMSCHSYHGQYLKNYETNKTYHVDSISSKYLNLKFLTTHRAEQHDKCGILYLIEDIKKKREVFP